MVGPVAPDESDLDPLQQDTSLSSVLLGVPDYLAPEEARALRDDLLGCWESQRQSIKSASIRNAFSADSATSAESLVADLRLMGNWFDPVASGKRLREAIEHLDVTEVEVAPRFPSLFFEVGASAFLLSPAGRAVLWLLARRAQEIAAGSPIWLAGRDADKAVCILNDQQLRWSFYRLRTVVGLLREDTSTLRPTAVGLLFAMLLNRNTSPDRRIPSPDNDRERRAISVALAAPALAFAQLFASSEKSTVRGLDLYQGWAMGELSRRLGSDLRRDSSGIWIEEEAVERATVRLEESIASRSEAMRSRVPSAVAAALDAYATHRTELAGLGLAYERPANTQRVIARVIAAANYTRRMGDGPVA